MTIQPQTSTPRTRCEAAADPPPTATALQATFADVDADTRPDVIWIYDAPDGTHLHLRTGRGATDDIVLDYGQGAVAVGSAQVDLAVGAPDPGAADEILAVTSDGDGRRLVGVYGFAINTGCLESFTFNQGAPFVYLVSRNGSLSGLRCVSDGVTGHLEGLTAVPSKATPSPRRGSSSDASPAAGSSRSPTSRGACPAPRTIRRCWRPAT